MISQCVESISAFSLHLILSLMNKYVFPSVYWLTEISLSRYPKQKSIEINPKSSITDWSFSFLVGKGLFPFRADLKIQVENYYVQLNVPRLLQVPVELMFVASKIGILIFFVFWVFFLVVFFFYMSSSVFRTFFFFVLVFLWC
jgi:hypothetical protein